MTTAVRTLTVVVHPAEEGGYWAEVLELPGCASQGETLEEVRRGIQEAIEAVAQHDPNYATIQIGPDTPEFRISSPRAPFGPDFPIGGTGTSTASAATG